MGADKALVVIDGEPLAARVAAVLHAAGASAVVLVGAGDSVGHLVGFPTIPDEQPESGPLGGLASALAWAARTAASGEKSEPPRVERLAGTAPEERFGARSHVILLVAACDQPSLRADRLTDLAAAVAGPAGDPGAIGAARFVTGDGRRHPMPSAWRVDRAIGPVSALHAAGERRIGAAFDVVTTADLMSDGEDLIDLDTASDLARWKEQHQTERHPPPSR